MQKQLTIVNYGMGNLHSLQNAFNQIGAKTKISSNPNEIKNADALILPGVGSFGQAINNINQFHLRDAIREAGINRAIPFLGICLGMQLLASLGEEDGNNIGLDLIKGKVIKLTNNNIRLPHIGFNEVLVKNDIKGLYNGIKSNSDFYFVHTYKFVCDKNDNILGTTNYGEVFTSSIQEDNIFGCQFHPEKSQSNGLQLLNNFIKISSKL
jgi:glutamine amidotransferase